MNTKNILKKLKNNKSIFNELLKNADRKLYLWKPNPDKWSLLEIVCHLLDEEKEDFRARVKQTLETPLEMLKPINPKGWVIKRKYIKQDYSKTLSEFISEREKSINWLGSLTNPNWESSIDHPVLGNITAYNFLSNWLAHDYLHFRQITKLKFDYLEDKSGEDLNYAGEW